MKITYIEWIELINQRLITFRQKILVSNYVRNRLEMTNGVLLTGNDIVKFKKRILNKKTEEWVKNSDNLFNGEISENQIKSILAKLGGKSCQRKHGEKIRQNLNIGKPWNKGKTGLSGTPHTDESKLKIGLSNTGLKNGMYGKRMTPEQKFHHSLIMKKLILSGKFTPNSNNRNTHWDSHFKNKAYRSSWEALYQYFDPAAAYEELRISYVLDNKERIYIVDFINHITKVCVEVKPRELCSGKKFNAKIDSLERWANQNGYTLLIVDKEWFKLQNRHIDFTLFDEKTQKKIKDLYK